MNLFEKNALDRLATWMETCTTQGMSCSEPVHRDWHVECIVSRGALRTHAVVYFNSKGRLTPNVQGGNQAFNEEVKRLLAGGAPTPPEPTILPASVESWIGVDESGKGDYFGPLVTAGVLVTPELRKQLAGVLIRDSKSMTDAMILSSAARIRVICDGMYTVVSTMPERYNTLINAPGFKGNSQLLLAWQHSRALENILERHPDVTHAICDQFGKQHVIENALMKHGRNIEVVQQTKAERDIAVAAASIIAREEFVSRLRRLEAQAGCRLPLGASDEKAIAKAIIHIINSEGRAALHQYAKLHFKTTKKLGF